MYWYFLIDDHFKEKIRTLTLWKKSEIPEIGTNKKQEEKGIFL